MVWQRFARMGPAGARLVIDRVPQPEIVMKKTVLLLAAGVVAAVPFAQQRPNTTLLFTVKGHVTQGDLAATPDGRRIYYVQDSTQLYMYDRSAGRSVLVVPNAMGRCVGLSPALDRLAFCRRGEDGDGPYLWTVALDPATGLPAGAARRVSLTKDITSPAFSPDGRSIAFGAYAAKDNENLVVAPANGGPERILARTGGDVWPISWLSSGIHYGVSYSEAKDSTRNGLYRIDPAGGTPTMAMRTADWGATPGMTPDGRSIVAWVPTWDSIVVASASGKRLAVYEGVEGLASPDVWRDATHALGWRVWRPRTVEIVNLTTGATHRVSDTLQNHVDPQWSADGREIAASYNRARLVVWRRDGTNRRVIRFNRSISPQYSVAWSPDGKSILYRQSQDSGAMTIIDLASQTQRVVAAKSSLGPPPRWRSDSRAILYAVIDSNTTPDSVRNIQIREVSTTGSDRLLHTVKAKCTRPPFCGKLVNDSLFATWVGGPAAEYTVTNVRARASRVIYARDGEGQPIPTFSVDGQWMAVRRRTTDDSRHSVEVMKIDGTARKNIPVSFRLASGPTTPWILAGGTELVVASAESDSEGHSFYRVDVATGKATKLVTLPKSAPIADLRLSPDGKSLAYVLPQTPYVNFYEFDFTGILKR
jgi:Tol biopolymer transport system component